MSALEINQRINDLVDIMNEHFHDAAQIISSYMVEIRRVNDEIARLIELAKAEEAKGVDITALYRSGVINPPMNDIHQMREAYWKYYPDEYIKDFGKSCAVEYSADRADWFPVGVLPDDIANYEWTRAEVKNFVDKAPLGVLLGIGY